MYALLMPYLSRQAAIAGHLPKYFTGQPCKHGHIAQRYTQSSSCMDCVHPPSGAGKRIPLKPHLTRMVKVYLILPEAQQIEAEALILSLAQSVAPLQEKHIHTNHVAEPTTDGRFRYCWRCFPEHKETILQLF